MGDGVLFLQPSKEGHQKEFLIVLPLLILHELNRDKALLEIDVLEPLVTTWSWKKFEAFEAKWELEKNNIYLEAGWGSSSFGGYYNISGGLAESFFTLQRFERVIEENKQFLKKDTAMPAPVQTEINSTTGVSWIYLDWTI
jgi:hypothetical protein